MFIERTIYDDGGRRDPGCFDGIFVCRDTKKIIISVSVSSSTKFSGGRIRWRVKVRERDYLICFLEFFNGRCGNFRNSR